MKKFTNVGLCTIVAMSSCLVYAAEQPSLQMQRFDAELSKKIAAEAKTFDDFVGLLSKGQSPEAQNIGKKNIEQLLLNDMSSGNVDGFIDKITLLNNSSNLGIFDNLIAIELQKYIDSTRKTGVHPLSAIITDREWVNHEQAQKMFEVYERLSKGVPTLGSIVAKTIREHKVETEDLPEVVIKEYELDKQD